MESNSSNDDDEPKICTVFSSFDQGSSSKTIFDTIAFTSPKKEEPSPSTSSFPSIKSTTFGASLFSEDKTIITPKNSDSNNTNIEIATASAAVDSSKVNLEINNPTNVITDEFSTMALNTEDDIDSKLKSIDQSSDIISSSVSNNNNEDNNLSTFENETILPTANILFSDTPEVPFPVGTSSSASSSSLLFTTTTTTNATISSNTTSPFMQQESLFSQTNSQISTMPTQPLQSLPIVSPHFNTNSTSITSTTTVEKQPVIGTGGGTGDDFFSSPIYSSTDSIYEAWIPSEETRKVLFTLTTATSTTSVDDAVRGAAQFMPGIPDKSKTPITTPGIVHEDDMYDKVAINMARIFGEAEASRRKILTADSVTQDDNGLRELIKLGCYRSAINLTKRLLTLYGQGPGKMGHFSKHSPHSLQLWYCRISLLVRIREFAIADSEVEAFKDFENPDMYHEFYSDLHGKGRRGSLVPFHFRLLAAEIPQYIRKTNDTFDKLTHILTTIEKIISNVCQGICEDGNPFTIDAERIKKSLEVWKKREVRVLYSLANAAIFAKDFTGAVHYLLKLIEKDSEHEVQLKSGLGRLYLQFGDITSAQRYFTLASDIRNAESESDKVDTLVDCGLLSIGQNNYADALNFFTEAVKLQPENYMLTNNMAVCLVYLGKVKDALSLMESTVKQNTPQLLQENVILNLSTIYELEDSAGTKKNNLLLSISEYKGDGVNLSSLKMANLV